MAFAIRSSEARGPVSFSRSALFSDYALEGARLTPKPARAGTSGRAQVFTVEEHPAIKEIEYHPGGGVHGDSLYYKLVRNDKFGGKNIEVRVIDPSPGLNPGTITRYQQYFDTLGNRLKYERGQWAVGSLGVSYDEHVS